MQIVVGGVLTVMVQCPSSLLVFDVLRVGAPVCQPEMETGLCMVWLCHLMVM